MPHQFIKDGKIIWPGWMFYFVKNNTAQQSPTDAFVAEAAVEDSSKAFQPSTSASISPSKKLLILNAGSFYDLDADYNLELAEYYTKVAALKSISLSTSATKRPKGNYEKKLALIKRLKVAGFEVCLQLENDKYFKVEEDFTAVLDNLSNLAKKEVDYSLLSKTIPTDKQKSILLDKEGMWQISQALTNNLHRKFSGAANGFESFVLTGNGFSDDDHYLEFKKTFDDFIKKMESRHIEVERELLDEQDALYAHSELDKSRQIKTILGGASINIVLPYFQNYNWWLDPRLVKLFLAVIAKERNEKQIKTAIDFLIEVLPPENFDLLRDFIKILSEKSGDFHNNPYFFYLAKINVIIEAANTKTDDMIGTFVVQYFASEFQIKTLLAFLPEKADLIIEQLLLFINSSTNLLREGQQSFPLLPSFKLNSCDVEAVRPFKSDEYDGFYNPKFEVLNRNRIKLINEILRLIPKNKPEVCKLWVEKNQLIIADRFSEEEISDLFKVLKSKNLEDLILEIDFKYEQYPQLIRLAKDDQRLRSGIIKKFPNVFTKSHNEEDRQIDDTMCLFFDYLSHQEIMLVLRDGADLDGLFSETIKCVKSSDSSHINKEMVSFLFSGEERYREKEKELFFDILGHNPDLVEFNHEGQNNLLFLLRSLRKFPADFALTILNSQRFKNFLSGFQNKNLANNNSPEFVLALKELNPEIANRLFEILKVNEFIVNPRSKKSSEPEFLFTSLEDQLAYLCSGKKTKTEDLCSPYLACEAAEDFSDQTYLCIGSIENQQECELVTKMVRKMPNVVTIEIFAGIQEYISQFCLFLVRGLDPRSFVVNIPSGINCSYSTQAKVVEKNYKTFLERRRIFKENPPSVTPQKPNPTITTPQALSDSTQEILVRNSALDPKIGVGPSDKDEGTDSMISAGEFLNLPDGVSKPRVRTGILKHNYDAEGGPEQDYYVPTKFTVSQTTNTNQFKTSSKIRAKFEQRLSFERRTRLLSISASEELVEILENPDDFLIEQGDDGFYYATARNQKKLSISFVLESNPVKTEKDCLDATNPIKQIIDDFKNPNKRYKDIGDTDDLPAFPIKGTTKEKDQWFADIFEKRAGVCRHRVMAVDYKLKNSVEIDRSNFRIVNIDNNHVLIEFKDSDDVWYQADLGGGLGNEKKVEVGKEYTLGKVAELSDEEKEARRRQEEIERQRIEQEQALQQKLIELRVAQEALHNKANQAAASDSGDPEPKKELSDEEKEQLEKLRIEQAKIEEQIRLEREKSIKRKELTKQLEQGLQTISSPLVVDSPDDLLTQIQGPRNKKILILAEEKPETHINYLTQTAISQGRKVYVIDGMSKIDIFKTSLSLKQKGNPEIKIGGFLKDFLESEDYSGNPPLIIIDWSKFSDNQKAALNTLIDRDESRSIFGAKVPEHFQIVGLIDKKPSDPSFTSRHNLFIEPKFLLTRYGLPEVMFVGENPEKIDLQGFPDWKRQLFGAVVLKNGKLIWEKSDFVKAIEAGKRKFKIENISQEAQKELAGLFTEFNAKGRLEYRGFEVDLKGKNLQLSFGQNFNFQNFKESENFSISVFENCHYFQARKSLETPNVIGDLLDEETLENLQPNFYIINDRIFDKLLHGKEIQDGNYTQTAGLIDKTDKGNTLSLFISSQLSESQFYCLFYQAKKRGIKLELSLAADVRLPQGLSLIKLTKSTPESTKTPPKIFIAKEPDLFVKYHFADQISGQKPLVIDVEDYSFADLFGKTTFEFEYQEFKNFAQTKSFIFEQIKAKKQVVLKGKFSAEMLKLLHPIIVGEDEFKDVRENLFLVIEDENPPEKDQNHKSLTFLEAGVDYQSFREEDLQPEEEAKYQQIKNQYRQNQVIKNEERSDDTSLAKSEQESLSFIENRKSIFKELLRDSSLLALQGRTGAGKSRLLKMFEDEKDGKFSIHRELNHLEDWLQDKSGKTPILFLDESNIDDFHYTMFNPLKKGGTREILFKGKLYKIPETHKVVFAFNPKSYGGGRFDQAVFDDGQVPVFHFADFPNSYIYEEILKKAVWQGLDAEAKKLISEADFKVFCEGEIVKYQTANQSEDISQHLTVRQLQQNAFKFVVEKYKKSLPEQYPPFSIATANFVQTSATSHLVGELNDILTIRKLGEAGKISKVGNGLNGILFEGGAGTGKSEMIKAVLEARGVKFVKIDVSLPYQEKRKLIIDAYEKGLVVWIDELNACIEDGLEKVLNAVLTGDHPDGRNSDGSERKIVPGFTMVSSINSVNLDGRSMISQALLARVEKPQVKKLQEYSVKDFCVIVNFWIKEDEGLMRQIKKSFSDEKNDSDPEVVDLRKKIAQIIAEDFVEILRKPENKNFNLRMLRENYLTLENILKKYQEFCKEYQVDLLELEDPINSTKPNPSFSPRSYSFCVIDNIQNYKIQLETKLGKFELGERRIYNLVREGEGSDEKFDNFSFVTSKNFNPDQKQEVLDEAKLAMKSAIFNIINDENLNNHFIKIHNQINKSNELELGLEQKLAVIKYVVEYSKNKDSATPNKAFTAKIPEEVEKSIKRISYSIQTNNQKFGVYTFVRDNSKMVGARSKRVIIDVVDEMSDQLNQQNTESFKKFYQGLLQNAKGESII